MLHSGPDFRFCYVLVWSEAGLEVNERKAKDDWQINRIVGSGNSNSKVDTSILVSSDSAKEIVYKGIEGSGLSVCRAERAEQGIGQTDK